MKSKRNKKNINQNLNELSVLEDFSLSFIFCLDYENNILRKKINNQKLTKEEELFDNFIIPPSYLLKKLRKGCSIYEEKNK